MVEMFQVLSTYASGSCGKLDCLHFANALQFALRYCHRADVLSREWNGNITPDSTSSFLA